jgi:hypothetical protein
MTDLEQDRFVVSIPQETIDDLKTRLRGTRWPADIDENDDYYGTSQAYLKDLVDYWLNEFDWREAERQLNQWDNYRVTIDGSPIHFIRQAGTGPAPIPLIMSHGWPWSYREWAKVIGPLTDPAAHGGDPADAFTVIVPSLSGFAFSTPTGRPDMNFWKMAELWHQLMTEYLGYQKYAAAGSDYGPGHRPARPQVRQRALRHLAQPPHPPRHLPGRPPLGHHWRRTRPRRHPRAAAPRHCGHAATLRLPRHGAHPGQPEPGLRPGRLPGRDALVDPPPLDQVERVGR